MSSRDSREESSAELEASLIGHEKAWSAPSKRARLCKALASWRWVIDTGLLVVILVLVLRKSETPKSKAPIGGDLSGYAPDFAQQIVTFSPDTTYVPENATDFFTDEIHQKWLDLVPRGLGYVEIGGAWQYDNLPTPLPEYSPKTVFTTSVTHQLHCLHSILASYAAMASPGAADDLRKDNAPWHLMHCFDYLRQSIMCSGDVALEGMQTTFPEADLGGSDGWDAKHVCRDYSQVYRYLSRRRATNDNWI